MVRNQGIGAQGQVGAMPLQRAEWQEHRRAGRYQGCQVGGPEKLVTDFLHRTLNSRQLR
jgi:hypothetical protein